MEAVFEAEARARKAVAHAAADRHVSSLLEQPPKAMHAQSDETELIAMVGRTAALWSKLTSEVQHDDRIAQWCLGIEPGARERIRALVQRLEGNPTQSELSPAVSSSSASSSPSGTLPATDVTTSSDAATDDAGRVTQSHLLAVAPLYLLTYIWDGCELSKREMHITQHETAQYSAHVVRIIIIIIIIIETHQENDISFGQILMLIIHNVGWPRARWENSHCIRV